MSWRPAIALAIVLTALVVFYLAYNPSVPEPPVPPLAKGVHYDFIEITRYGEEVGGEKKYVLERKRSAWEMTHPEHRRVDPLRISEMIAVLQTHSERIIMPGDPDWDPAAYGLESPTLSLRAQPATQQAFVVHFGKPVKVSPDLDYCKREDQDYVRIMPSAVRKAFEFEAEEVRDRNVVYVPVSRALRVTGKRKYEKAAKKGGRVVEYEEFEIVRDKATGGKGWRLIKPIDEALDMEKVSRLLAQLGSMKAEEFRPWPGPHEALFAGPLPEYRVWEAGVEDPLTITFAGPVTEVKDKPPKYLVRVDEEAEFAEISAETFGGIPADYNDLRNNQPFAYPVATIRSIAVEPRGGRKVVLAQEVKEEGGLRKREWKVTEPEGLEVDRQTIVPFLKRVLSLRILQFMGAQDEATFGLKNPKVTVTLSLEIGEETQDLVFKLSGLGEAEDGYLKRADDEEICRIRGDDVRALTMVEYTLGAKKMFDVARSAITGFGFRHRTPLGAETRYRVRKAGKDEWAWVEPGPDVAGREVDPVRVMNILNQLNYIKAESFVGLGPEYHKKYALSAGRAAVEVAVEWADGKGGTKTAVLFVTDDLKDSPKIELYYARFAESPVVFRIQEGLIEDLKRHVYKRGEAVPDE
ncbi:MAG: DUF4340 domain-containing protein [Planctomycetota bacterium]|jgi:hypothetical protein